MIIATNANYMRGKEAINELCESMTHARLWTQIKQDNQIKMTTISYPFLNLSLSL